MLGALKRRLKPKRATSEKENQNGRKNVHSRSETIIPVDVARLAPSQRQIHPLFEEKAQLPAYDENKSPNKTTPTPNLKRFSGDSLQSPLLQLPKKSPVEPMYHGSPHFLTPTGPTSAFSPAPNICVEQGRIEFIKSPSEGANLAGINPKRGSFDKKMKLENVFQCSGVFETKNEGAAKRAQRTQPDSDDFEKTEEKCDVAKEVLEARVKELEKLLELEEKAVQKEKLTVARLQRQLAKREATQRDVDRERRLRADTESRLRETVSESERYRTSLAGLQREFSKMEDTVRTMLQYKTRCEILNQEKIYLTAAYESRVHQYQNTITELEQENESMRQQLHLLESTGTADFSTALLDRLRSLETENAHLSQDADFQRKEYEKCLDDIANQIVRALLSQKGLREEVGNLQRRIKELEVQNQALTNILVNKLEEDESMIALPSPIGKAGKKDFSSEIVGSFSTNMSSLKAFADSSPGLNSKPEERKLLRRLHFSDLGDKNILKSLSSFESLVYVPLQRPKSLNLHLHTSPKALSAVNFVAGKRCQHKKSKMNLVTLSKKSGEDEGNESPESGNRDEGYSTMSSDVQGTGETNELSKRELEDLKEASDETDVIVDSNGEMTSIVVVEDMSDADLYFIPLDLSLAFNARHSFPPSKKFCPSQHTVRSLSDSHLCLKLTTSAASPALSPSVLLLDFLERSRNLRRNKPAFSLTSRQEPDKELEDFRSSSGSWCTAGWWDTEFVQHWLKLEDTRLKQQQQRDLLQLQYDRTEIEEWSMSLSCEDIGKSTSEDLIDSFKFDEILDSPKLENRSKGDANEWNEDPTTDKKTEVIEEEDSAEKSTWRMTSSNESWSSEKSNSEDCCRLLNDCYFNDHSGVDSNYCYAVSDDAEESSAIDTDFTRDFYRLVKFESTKSLASNSSKSNAFCDLNSLNQTQAESDQEREMALQDVLNYIAEQQKYCNYREEGDIESQSCYSKKCLELQEQNPSDVNETNFYCVSVETKNAKELDDDLKQIARVQESEIATNHLNESGQNNPETGSDSPNKNPGASAVNLVNDHKKTVSSNKRPGKRSVEKETKLPVRNFNSRNCPGSGKPRTEQATKTLESAKSKPVMDSKSQSKKNEVKSPKCNLSKSENPECKEMSESFSSSVSTPDTIVLQTKRSPLGSPTKSCGTEMLSSSSSRLSNRTLSNSNIPRPRTNPRVRKSKIPVVSNKKQETNKPQVLDLEKPNSSDECGLDRQSDSKTRAQDSIRGSAKKSPDSSIPKVVVVNDTSFHEKATSKDVIEELNRMIRKGEETTPKNSDRELRPLDMACCCSTGWVHVEKDIDFTDPKARANLLDVMLASSGSSGGSCSSSDSGGDEHINYTHLHRLHRFRRQRKASATREQLGVLRYSLSSARPTIIGRENFFVRYGEKEKEAVASFDFLEDISTASASGCSSSDSLDSNRSTCLKSGISPTDQELPSPGLDLSTPVTPSTPITPSDDSDERAEEPVTFSDSCGDSCSESTGSFEEQA